jgi:hypothetical protein
MSRFVRIFPIVVCMIAGAFFCEKAPSAPKKAQEPPDWAALLSRPLVAVSVSPSLIEAVVNRDTAGAIRLQSIDWPVADAALLNSAQWVLKGPTTYYNAHADSSFPSTIILRYAIDTISYRDTLSLEGAKAYLQSIHAGVVSVGDTNEITVTWDHAKLTIDSCDYMMLQVGSTEFFYSFSNYAGFPEAIGGSLYGRFSFRDDSCVIKTRQSLYPLVSTVVPQKFYDNRLAGVDYRVFLAP